MPVPELASVDGEITPTAEARIPAADDGLLRGDGVFEVIRLYAGRPFALGEHLDRLERSAAAIELPVERAALEGEIERPARASSATTRASCGWSSPAAAAGSPSPSRCPTQRRDDRARHRHLLADDHPHRGQVALLRGQHAGDPARQGARAPTRPCWSAPTASCSRRPTSTIFWVDADGELRTPVDRDRDPRLDHPRPASSRELDVEEGELPARRPARRRARPSSPRPRARSSRSRAIDGTRAAGGARARGPSEARDAFAEVLERELRTLRAASAEAERGPPAHRRAEADLARPRASSPTGDHPAGPRQRPRRRASTASSPRSSARSATSARRSPRSTAAAASTTSATA